MADITATGNTSYPASLDTRTTLIDGSSGNEIVAANPNGPAAAVIAVETELGTSPKGTSADVKTRLGVALNGDGTLKPFSSTTLPVGPHTLVGILAVSTTQVTSATAGDIVIPLAQTLRAVSVGGAGTQTLIGLDTNGVIQLGDTTTGVAVSRLTAIAASAALKGVIYADTAVAGQLVFFDGVTGARYKLTGTAF